MLKGSEGSSDTPFFFCEKSKKYSITLNNVKDEDLFDQCQTSFDTPFFVFFSGKSKKYSITLNTVKD